MDCRQLLCAALCIVSILKFSHGVDKLSVGQTLGDGDVLTSPGQIFELGFFYPGKSTTSRFLGIWYKATPDVVIWVANKDNPILNSHGVLTLSKNGTLILSSTKGKNVWSSSSPMVASLPVLQLLDSGNLVLLDNTSNTWQSFDYPGNTRLPGMKMVESPDPGFDKHLTSWKSTDDPSTGYFVYRIENQGLSQMSIVSRRGGKRYRTGPWNGLYFTGLPRVPEPALDVETVFRNGRLVSVSNAYNSSVLLRLTLNFGGFLQQFIMNVRRDTWIPLYSIPSDVCDNYGKCGPNALCTSKSPMCECLKGFMPKSQKEWNSSTWRRGCTRTLSADCHREDGFLEVERIKFPDPLNFRINDSMSVHECRSECLKNCSCSAYAAPYLSSERVGCFMWFGELIDVREFTGNVSTSPSIYIRVPNSELEGKRKLSKSAYVEIASVLGLLFVGLVFGCMIWKIRRRQQAAWDEKREDLELPLFGLATIAAATNDFSDENIIGKGGFGPVYKGNLSDTQVVAVKRMSRTSGQGPQEFKNEVVLIAKLQHRNLVKILGCCIEEDEMMLIYEYMQNKSLDFFIFDENRSAELSWPKRFDIIMGIARGLLYLHHDSRLKVIHRDLKTSNILLDENLNAKISDFGLARMFQVDQTSESTDRVVGTHGYMAPEYIIEGEFSMKSDVYSLGVIILEIVSGKKNRGFKHPSCYYSLLEHAWLLWMENRALEVMDPCYNDSYVEFQVKRCIQVGLLCVQNKADDRPVMPSVFLMLSSEDSVLPQPTKPGFFLQGGYNSLQMNELSGGFITVSDVEGR